MGKSSIGWIKLERDTKPAGVSLCGPWEGIWILFEA